MIQRVFDKTGIRWRPQTIIIDRDGLWSRLGMDAHAEANGFAVEHFIDEMQLRRAYEHRYRYQSEKRAILVPDAIGMHIPFDIAQRFHVIELTFDLVFPNLHAETLRRLPGIDYSLLSFCVDAAAVQPLSAEQTEALCRQGMYSAVYAASYANRLLDQAVTMAVEASTYREWGTIAQMYGKAAMIHHGGMALYHFAAVQQNIENQFKQWIGARYNILSGSVDRRQPVLLSGIADYIRKQGGKIALIVMDGMSFENLFTIQRCMVDQRYSFDSSGVFSFFPTVTCVARQSIFSGKLPCEHEKPYSLINEEKQWRAYWNAAGFREHEVDFFKTEMPEIKPDTRVAGIVLNIIDDLMHAQLQGMSGMQKDIQTWMEKAPLQQLLDKLLGQGFQVYMTSDHGNTAAIAQGRFTKPGILAEPASRRAIIYQDYVDAQELEKFTVFQYAGTYLPDGCKTYLFEPGTCYGDRGKEYVTHGGMAIEEAIVPFVRVGVVNG